MTTTKKKLASIAISVQPRCFHTLTHLASPAMMGALTKDFALGLMMHLKLIMRPILNHTPDSLYDGNGIL